MTARQAVHTVADTTMDAAGFLARKAGEALHSARAERVSDAVLTATEDAANGLTGDRHTERVGAARSAVDRRIGDE